MPSLAIIYGENIEPYIALLQGNRAFRLWTGALPGNHWLRLRLLQLQFPEAAESDEDEHQGSWN